MKKTINYGLYLTDSDQEKFKAWREAMNGIDDESNMSIIDRVLGDKPDKADIPTKVSDLDNDSNFQTANEVNEKVNEEYNRAKGVEDSLQNRIDAIEAQSDVVDVVGTHKLLEDYRKPIYSGDLIKVLSDETMNGQISYYRASYTIEEPIPSNPNYGWKYETGQIIRNVPQSTASDVGKFLRVASDGSYEWQSVPSPVGEFF